MNFHKSIVQTTIPTPLGPMVLAATHAGLAGAWFTDQRYRPEVQDFKNLPHPWPQDNEHPTLVRATQQLAEFFERQRSAFDLTFDISGGTLFQQSVWRALIKIDHGKLSTYGQIARQIDKPAAVRAVGMAVGRNPLGILVPCHRVVGSNGALTGYAGGLHRKVWLLDHEGVPGYSATATSKPTTTKPAVSSPSPQARLL